MKFKKLWQVLVFCLGIMLMFFAVFKGIGFLENKFFPDVEASNPYFWGVINRLICTFIGILILKKLGKIDILKDRGKGLGYGFLLGCVTLLPNILYSLSIIVNLLFGEPELQPVSIIITIICMFLTVGLCEELMYRGIVLGIMDDYFGRKSVSGVWKTVVLSGIAFGIFHLQNLGAGVSLLPVLAQVINATAVGIVYAALYMRHRNLYSMMLLHAICDLLPATWLFKAGTSLWRDLSSSKVNFISTFIWLIINVLFAMFILRKKKMKEIIDCDYNKSSLKIKV